MAGEVRVSISTSDSGLSGPLSPAELRPWDATGSALLAFLLACGSVSCHTQPAGAPAAQEAAPESIADSAHRPAPRGEPSDAPQDRFTRPHRLQFEQVGDLAEALPLHFERQELRDQVLPLPKSETLWIGLDQHPPRRIGKRELRVVDLLNEDEEVAPGRHFFVVLDRAEPGAWHYQLHFFTVEVRPTGLPRAPGCLLFTDRLTYNGPQPGSEVHFVVVPLMGGVDRVLYRVEGPQFLSAATVEVGDVLGLGDARSGDYFIQASCLASGETRSLTQRIITVNADAPASEAGTP